MYIILNLCILHPLTVPAITGVEIEEGSDGLTVQWSFLHTGGSDIEQIEILLRESRDEALFELVAGGNIPRPLNDSFLISGSGLKAGRSYEVGVRASNEIGTSSLAVSGTLESAIGMFNRGQMACTHN